MVTDTEGYIHIIEYLTEHLSLFENSATAEDSESVMEVIEIELSEQIIMVCSQNSTLSFNQRNAIIREVDAIVYDLEEILSGVVNNPVTAEQRTFIKEFAGLIKNLFDSVINTLLTKQDE
ncbi:DUF3802 family protein [Litorilituus lipolyticus]|uniref:DUF3802 family protein n=1 Tax=Litorilituus lipolyticus TaxID=2491017 RepID=A0A502L457_9GAMM|nr:DUF3802 family protein [Litorilituus lipolyticus]TPH17649.1 DUF3802 family protein [Litorilituus lipolyticus]